MGPITLTLLCVCSCLVTGTALGIKDLKTATRYIEERIFSRHNNQYAYFVKFTPDECDNGLQEEDVRAALGDTTRNEVILSLCRIYKGTRMVAAAPLQGIEINGKIGNVHSEYRLLDGGDNSPIGSLLRSPPRAGCVLFFSLNSPCVETCTRPGGRYNIIKMLDNTQGLPTDISNRAFIFRNVFHHDMGKDISTWATLNHVFPLFRCNNNQCTKCFPNNVGDNTYYDNNNNLEDNKYHMEGFGCNNTIGSIRCLGN
ncbi:uncharacterized protein [Dendropsophus ebraccatus]|uniref:uncharacterized protein n=1 Tax=Dendropsophus ebraccatus TaxID=150705 RepID=UPI0038321DE1